jgi:hypothetical protein
MYQSITDAHRLVRILAIASKTTVWAAADVIVTEGGKCGYGVLCHLLIDNLLIENEGLQLNSFLPADQRYSKGLFYA